ncbi:MAG: pilus assembly protein [Candidatus Gygaella obscura]|nr:pilus assembly protein [Candidatus Gygaella obscura]
MKRINIKAQAAIEFTLALIVLFLFLLGSLRLFIWSNKNLVYRQENYSATRRLAGDPLVMRSWQTSVNELYEEDTEYNIDKNKLKNIVVNEFYVDKDRLPDSYSIMHDGLVSETESELNSKRAPGITYDLHEYEKFEMFSGAE